MIRSTIIIILISFLNLSLFAQNNLDFEATFRARSFLHSDRLPFWLHNNTQGLLSENSDYGVSAFAKAEYKLSQDHNLSLGVGGYLANGFENSIRRSDLFLEYENNLIKVIVGSKSLPESELSNSVINNNILFTGNTRALPGLFLSNNKPLKLFKNISFDAEIAHYQFNDDRSVDNARLHYKKVGINWRIRDKSSLHVSLRHYVQWAGTQGDGTKLPGDFNAFFRTFTGANGGDIDNDNEAINALGNHLGTYEVSYLGTYKSIDFKIYHNTLFEDRSGRELNNFPDGVWGVSVFPKTLSFIDNVTYEYIQTVSQSGSPRATEGLNQQSGGDNYFRNSIYGSGWTYEGLILGLPLINPFGNTTTPQNNRVFGHHLGLNGRLSKIHYKLKGTYVENLGRYNRPIEPRQRALYTSMQVQLPLAAYGAVSMYSGADFINNFENTYAIGIGYNFSFD
ncbi:capsule assembly Wzi family protein [Dokdonia donghaensis]|uniref:Capsule assembly protein Wzi n=1 Tax=Dokdonia donghaensis DSW-1 TaxID=1300343 RepID=A0A0A2GT70_9FLAO|nr:capsule assembly Wzi family protein [Dokdonia donghaensis]ANH61070.1 hypothetical protein I597_2172 [Dokdonia donghaensis DSW-1]KGO05708.1 hypothetical protein NV36_01810 [Dokdonia donghaensis DSW-1]